LHPCVRGSSAISWMPNRQAIVVCSLLSRVVRAIGESVASVAKNIPTIDPALFCTCRCDGCVSRGSCRAGAKAACETNGGSWCSCEEQSVRFHSAVADGFVPFPLNLDAGEKDDSGAESTSNAPTPPHIVFVLADDLGLHDLSWRNPDAFTPTLDALRTRGVELTNYYTLSMCSPSRAALATGRYPFRYGMQSYVLLDPQPWGLPLSEITLAQQLKSLFGYETQFIGASIGQCPVVCACLGRSTAAVLLQKCNCNSGGWRLLKCLE
jgi:Sulfatase